MSHTGDQECGSSDAQRGHVTRFRRRDGPTPTLNVNPSQTRARIGYRFRRQNGRNLSISWENRDRRCSVIISMCLLSASARCAVVSRCTRRAG